MQPDHVEPGVLTTLEQVVPDHERRAVPVVVPDRVGDAGLGVQGPQDRRLGSIERRSPGTGCRANPRSTGGTRQGRCSPIPSPGRPSAGRSHRLPGPAVQEVVRAVVRVEPNLDLPLLTDEHVRLAGPARPAPLAGAVLIRRRSSTGCHRRVAPRDARIHRDRPGPVVGARRIAPERRDALERRVGGPGAGRGARGGGGEVVVVVGVGLCIEGDGAATASFLGRGQSSKRQARVPPTATTRIAGTRTVGTRGRAACRARRRWTSGASSHAPDRRIGSDRTLGRGVRTQDLQHPKVQLDLVERGRDVLVLRRAVQVDVEDVLERRSPAGDATPASSG